MDASRREAPTRTWGNLPSHPSFNNEHEFLRQANITLAAFDAGNRADAGTRPPVVTSQPGISPVVFIPPLSVSPETTMQCNVIEKGSDTPEVARRLSFKEAVHQIAASAKDTQVESRLQSAKESSSNHNKLPVSALPYTLRSSSLAPSNQPRQPDEMTGPAGGLGASRYASSANPLAPATNGLQSTSSSNSSARSSVATSNPRQANVTSRLSFLRDKKAIERELAAEQEKAHFRAEVLQAELRAAEEQEQAELDEAHRVEVNQLEKGKQEKVSRDQIKTEHLVKTNKDLSNDEAKDNQVVRQLEVKLAEIHKAEIERKKRGEGAGMTALEELSRADARCKDLSKDKVGLTKIVEEATSELKAIQAQLVSTRTKLADIDGELLDAHKVFDEKNKNVTSIENASKAARTSFEKERDALVAKIEALRTTPTNTSAPVPFHAKGAIIKAGAGSSHPSVKTEGRETFPVWPVPAQDRGASQVRRVKLTGFPPNAALTNVQTVVWGGNIQEFQYQPGAPIAIALFVKAADCAKFFAATANGIPYPSDATLTIMVEKLEAEPAHGIVKEYVEKDITRCVRVYDIDAEWGKLALQRLAQGSNNRVVERIVNGQNSKGRRIADFRFAKISDAVLFKGELDRDVDWEACTIKCGPDPCALHNTVHTGMM